MRSVVLQVLDEDSDAAGNSGDRGHRKRNGHREEVRVQEKPPGGAGDNLDLSFNFPGASFFGLAVIRIDRRYGTTPLPSSPDRRIGGSPEGRIGAGLGVGDLPR